MSPSEQELALGRQRICQVFRYLEALNQARNSAQRHLANQLWHFPLSELPDHPSIQLATFADKDRLDPNRSESSTIAADDYVLKVRRPKLTDCPPPPENLLSWLERGWHEPTVEPRVKTSRN